MVFLSTNASRWARIMGMRMTSVLPLVISTGQEDRIILGSEADHLTLPTDNSAPAMVKCHSDGLPFR
jgi:hypothetical protein